MIQKSLFEVKSGGQRHLINSLRGCYSFFERLAAANNEQLYFGRPDIPRNLWRKCGSFATFRRHFKLAEEDTELAEVNEISIYTGSGRFWIVQRQYLQFPNKKPRQ